MNLNNVVQSPPKDAVYDIVQQQYVTKMMGAFLEKSDDQLKILSY